MTFTFDKAKCERIVRQGVLFVGQSLELPPPPPKREIEIRKIHTQLCFKKNETINCEHSKMKIVLSYFVGTQMRIVFVFS